MTFTVHSTIDITSCTLQALEHFGALYMHNHNDKCPTRPGFETSTFKPTSNLENKHALSKSAQCCTLSLDMKGCICHFVTWQIHPFISKGTTCAPNGKFRTRKGCSVEHVSPRQQCIIMKMVSQTEVQWKGLSLKEPPTSSRCPLHQVSVLDDGDHWH